MFRQLFTTAALTSAVAILPASASSQERDSEEVHYVDLDLRSDAGVKTLDGRIKKAVRKVCAGHPKGGTFELMYVAHCKSQTLAAVTPLRDRIVTAARTRDGIVEFVAIAIAPSAKIK